VEEMKRAPPIDLNGAIVYPLTARN
jgi:hypothetical protein